MSALEDVPQQRLAEMLMTAVTRLAEPVLTTTGSLVPIGVPVRHGRLHLGRLRSMFDTTEPLNVAVGFATACWIGARGMPFPSLGRLGYRSATDVDSRGRVVLDHRVRAWLGVPEPMCFDVVTAPAADGGLLIMPVDDFARRWKEIS